MVKNDRESLYKTVSYKKYADGRYRTQSDSELSHQAAYDNTTDGPQEYSRPEYFCWQRQTETLSPAGTPLRLIR